MTVTPAATAEYGELDRDGRKLRWKRVGSGPAVVLEIGAGAGGVDLWGPLETDLARTHTVVTYDRAGMGESDAIPGGPTLASWTADLHAVVTEVAGGRAALVGWSLGALMALSLTYEHPEAVAGVVLIDPTEDRHGWLQVLLYKYVSSWTTSAAARVHALQTRSESGRAKVRRRSIAQADKIAPALSAEERARVVEYMANGEQHRAVSLEVPVVCGAVADLNRLRDRLPTPDVPVVVLSATKGPLRKHLWAAHQRLALSFPRGEFALADGCSHMIPLEKPELAAAAVRDLLAKSGAN